MILKKLICLNWKALGLGMLLFTGLVLSANAALSCDTPPSSGDCSGDITAQIVSGNDPRVCHKDRPDDKCPATKLAATVNITQAGYYSLETTSIFDSGDDQLNESYYLTVENFDGTVQLATDGNAGNYYVVEDAGGPASSSNEFSGTFWFNEGVNKIYLNHYSLISDSYPQFLNEPVDIWTESVAVHGICLTFIPPTPPSSNPKIHLDKVGPEYAVPGQEITYTLNWSVEDDSVTNLVLADPVPAKTVFVSASDSGIYDALTNSVVWNLGGKNAGDSGSATLTVHVDLYTYDTDFIANTAVLDSDETEPVEDTVETEMDAHCVLTINKVDDIDPVQPGDQITYTIEYQNTGDGICVGTGVMLAEYFDQAASFVSSAPEMPHYSFADLPYDPMPGDLGEPDALWQWTELVPDGPHYMKVIVDVSAQVVDGQTLTNKVCLWAENAAADGGEDTICTTETTTVEIPEEPYFNLAIKKTANKNKVEVGDELTYTIDWQVTGNAIAPNVAITDTLPAEISLISASGVYSTTSDSVIWNLGDITANATGTIELIARIDSMPISEELVNTAKIKSGEKSAESNVTTPLEYFNLYIDKNADLSVAQPGDEIIYTINWEITGNATATDVSIYDFLPEGAGIVSANPVYDNVMTVVGTNYPVYTLVWNLGDVMPNATGTIEIAAIAASDLKNGVQLENTAKIISGEKSVEDSALTNITLEEKYFSLQIDKSGPTEVKVGDSITFDINWSVSGTATATDVVIVDSLPSNVSFISADNGGLYNSASSTVTWNLGDSASGTVGSFKVVVGTAGLSDGDKATNNVTMSSDGKEVSDEATTSVTKVTISVCTGNCGGGGGGGFTPNPQVKLEHNYPLTKQAGSQYVETITVINSGNVILTNGVISIDFPEEYIKFISSDATPYVYDVPTGKVTWTLTSAIGVGKSEIINVTIQALQAGNDVATAVNFDSAEADANTSGEEDIITQIAPPVSPPLIPPIPPAPQAPPAPPAPPALAAPPVVRGKITTPLAVAPAATTSVEVAEVCPKADSCAGCNWWVWLIIVLLHILLLFIYWFYASKEEIKENENGEYYIIKGSLTWFLPVILILAIVFLLLVFLCTLQPWWALLMILAAYFLSLIFYSAMLKRAEMKYSPFLPIIVTIAVLVVYLLCASWPWWVWVLMLVFYILTLASYYLVIVKMDVKNRNYWWLVPLFMTAFIGALLMVMRLCQCQEVIL